MASVLERETVTKELPEKEEKYLNLTLYKRDGLIPAWAEVVNRFELKRLPPRDLKLLRGYYREQRRIAEGRNKKAQRVFRCLAKNPDYLALEKERASLFNNIASFVRKKI
ncbi:MAG: hypothetical protein MUP45_04010 [Candidatus Marinimicrobia bacterium]|nr:hypothetical protein [Candidatus Neomarinimicrobiota bacterium]